jgi:hypothetical protein
MTNLAQATRECEVCGDPYAHPYKGVRMCDECITLVLEARK